MQYNIEIGAHTKKSDKNNKKIKVYSYKKRLEKIELTTLLERRMRGDPTEIFKIINGISNYSRYFFSISPQIGNSRQISKTKSTNQLDFFVKRVKYFWNKFPNQIKNRNNILKIRIKLDGFRKNGKKKN